MTFCDFFGDRFMKRQCSTAHAQEAHKVGPQLRSCHILVAFPMLSVLCFRLAGHILNVRQQFVPVFKNGGAFYSKSFPQ